MKNILQQKYIYVYTTLLVGLVLLFLPILSSAQELPPDPPGVPVDGGLIYLIVGIFAAGGGRLLYVYRSKFRRKE